MINLSKFDVARIYHQANKAYCESIGDYTQQSWENAPQWQRDSAVSGVEFHLATPGAGPDASHINWMAEKLADGWKYSLRKDAEKKTHHCLVPFKDLPKEQQLKDSLFLSIVNVFRDLR